MSSVAVTGQWYYVQTAPDEFATADDLRVALRDGRVVATPMSDAVTIASAMREGGLLDLDAPPAFDAHDWWVGCKLAEPTSFEEPADENPVHPLTQRLTFDGLASVVDVWWNSVWLGRSNNMFVPWSADVERHERDELLLCSRAMTPRLAPRRPRARWRSRLLESQEWRWHRTSHLGRMPGVGPRVPAVGVWQPIRLSDTRFGMIDESDLVPSHDGQCGRLRVRITGTSAAPVTMARLTCGAASCALHVAHHGHQFVISGEWTDEAVEPWVPHTHGAPRTYDAALQLEMDGERRTVALGRVGFREHSFHVSAQGAWLRIGDGEVFLRGTCWTPHDWARLETIDAQFEGDLPLLKAAGINLVRFSGAFTYPTARMLSLCDEHGLCVWHDLMFSVLDYPRDDEAFLVDVRAEVQHVARVARGHVSVLVLCGASEVEQQAVMMGVPAAECRHALFHDHIASMVHEAAPELPYWPGTPTAGALPTQLTAGTAHYFGVGAYLRTLDDARRAAVRFATECLAFANLAEPASPSFAQASPEPRATPSAADAVAVHVNRDGGASWDFADTRDHYAAQLARVDVASLRSMPVDRYAAFGRAAVANAIARTMQEFRRLGSPTRGAITWLWRDPWPGAGWGMVDYDGYPKSAWYGMARASRPIAIAATDEGLDGVYAQAWNDSDGDVRGTLHVRLISSDGAVVLSGQSPLELKAHSAACVACDLVLGAFTDSTNAYRFGVPKHVAVHVAWTADSETAVRLDGIGTFDDQVLIDDDVLPLHGDYLSATSEGALHANLVQHDDQRLIVHVSSERPQYFVRAAAAGWRCDEGYFALTPGVTRTIRAVPASLDSRTARTLRVESLTDSAPVHLTLP